MRRSLSKPRLHIPHGPWRDVTGRVGALIIAGAALAFAPAQLHGQEEVPATECCLEMQLPVSARAVALGQALTARSGSDAVFVNPAGLAEIDRTQAIAHRSDVGLIAVTSLAFLVHSKLGMSFGLTYELVDFGQSDAIPPGQTDPTGTLTDVRHMLVASFATNVSPELAAGLNYRLFNFSLTCEGFCEGGSTSATTHMLDAGVQYRPKWDPRLALGAALLHAGFPLQVNNAAQSDVTPTRLRLGGAYDISRFITKDSTVAAWVHADAISRVRGGLKPALNVGVEVILDRTLFFRAGNASGTEGITSGGAAVGLGLKYQRFEINLAKSVTTNEVFGGEPFYVSFGIGF